MATAVQGRGSWHHSHAGSRTRAPAHACRPSRSSEPQTLSLEPGRRSLQPHGLCYRPSHQAHPSLAWVGYFGQDGLESPPKAVGEGVTERLEEGSRLMRKPTVKALVAVVPKRTFAYRRSRCHGKWRGRRLGTRPWKVGCEGADMGG